MTSKLLPVLVSALLVSCASSPERGGALFLESDGYMCGAEAGLGCGLALAPVLEQIDELPGVAGSEATWDGRLFRIELDPGAHRARVAAEAKAVLGAQGTASVSEVGSSSAGRDSGTRWFDAEETIQLSLHEAGVLARSWSAGIRSEVQLDGADAERLEDLLRAELEAAFTKAHEAGGGLHRLMEQAPAARPRLEERMVDFLTAEQRAAVLAFLDRVLAQ